MSNSTAVYAGSFDPVTFGHLNLIQRASRLFNQVIVILAVDNRKKYMFTVEEREDMIKQGTRDLRNVKISVYDYGYTVRHAQALGASVLNRGIRNSRDLEEEQIMATENLAICPQVETLFLPCLPSLAHISSSMVKAHVGMDHEWENQVARLVPEHVLLKLKQKYIPGQLRKHWDSLMSRLGNPLNGNAVFAKLVRMYSEPHRAYHNLEHITDMLDELAGTNLAQMEREEIELAIWFHDAIYDPVAAAFENEQNSAKLAMAVLPDLVKDKGMVEFVGSMILESTHQKKSKTYLGALFLDLDLVILGKPERKFARYEQAIREEYKHVPERDFCAGRAKILSRFLERDAIYQVKIFVDKYAAQARANIKSSIEKLNLELTAT